MTFLSLTERHILIHISFRHPVKRLCDKEVLYGTETSHVEGLGKERVFNDEVLSL